MDAHLLHSAIKAGAYIIANAGISEPVKDGYRLLKSRVALLYGSRAVSALDNIESEETRSEGERQLTTFIPDLQGNEANELEPAVRALVHAIASDSRAQAILQQAKITLDLSAGGDIVVSQLTGATDVGMRVGAGGDITVSGIQMGPRGSLGN